MKRYCRQLYGVAGITYWIFNYSNNEVVAIYADGEMVRLLMGDSDLDDWIQKGVVEEILEQEFALV